MIKRLFMGASLIALVLYFIYGILGADERTWLLIPGTIMHEGMHYLVALFLGGSPTSFNIVPKHVVVQNMEFIMQGSVVFLVNTANSTIAPLAPVLLIPFIPFFLFLGVIQRSLILKTICFYLSLCVWDAWMPSMIDFHIATENPASYVYAWIGLPTLFILITLSLRGLLSRIESKHDITLGNTRSNRTTKHA